MVCGTIVIPALIFTPNYLTSGLESDCLDFSQDPSSQAYLYFALPWTGLVILLPWIFILAFTVTTIWKLKQASLRRAQMTFAANPPPNDPLKRTRLMALVIAITFLVALIPEIIVNCLAIMEATNALDIYSEVRLSRIIYVFFVLKSSVNFFLCIGTNEQFRQIFLKPFRLCISKLCL